MTSSTAAQKFDTGRAGDYRTQSRIALAGYDACHELAACMLATALGNREKAHLLVVGAGGGGQEIVSASRLAPDWRFTAVDPSEAMMDLAVSELTQAGLVARTDFHSGYVEDLPEGQMFDAATLIGVLHHQSGDEAKHRLLASIADRLIPDAPLIVAGNRLAYAEHPLLLSAWGERWRMHGATAQEVRARLGKILEGADPPASEEKVGQLLGDAGFGQPVWFFSSLFWGACLVRRA